jgi:hydrogenase nickel incorporation protein HypA/HybF
MHELAVTESILEIAVKHAQPVNASRVTDIYITLGQLSSIVDDSVQFYWDLLSKDTICAGSTLHFTRIQAKLQCQQCQHEYGIERELEPCPNCGSFAVKVLAGEEFYLDSIAVENESEQSSQ